MKHSLLALLAVCSMSAMASDFQCLPKQAGGGGINFTVAESKTGTVYTWWCGEGKPNWTSGATDDKPKVPTDPKKLADELLRLEVMRGYSRNPDLFRSQAEAQLKMTKPASRV